MLLPPADAIPTGVRRGSVITEVTSRV